MIRSIVVKTLLISPGLIVYLAHIGSFVPADSAVIGIVSHIFTRMQSTECIAAHMSAFLIDLRQVITSIVSSIVLVILVVLY